MPVGHLDDDSVHLLVDNDIRFSGLRGLRLRSRFGFGDHGALLDDAARTVADRQFDTAQFRQNVLFQVAPRSRHLLERQFFLIGRLLAVDDVQHGLPVGHRRLRDQRAARLPILGDGIHRHLVLFREIVLPVDIRLEIAGPLGSQRFVELQRTVGRRIARDRHGADLPERILHKVVHKGVESVQLLRIAVERGIERRQIDLVANRIVGVAAAFDDEPANDVVSVGSLRQQYGIGRRSRNRTLGLGRRSGSGTQRERKSES